MAALERDLDAYLARGPLRITTKVREDDPTYFDFYFDATEPVPPELSAFEALTLGQKPDVNTIKF